jgi:hypothetical protein
MRALRLVQIVSVPTPQRRHIFAASVSRQLTTYRSFSAVADFN